MKLTKIKVPFYKWKIISIIVDNHKEQDAALNILKKYHVTKEHIELVTSQFTSEAMDGAVCLYNNNKLITVIVVYPHTSVEELVATLIHEGRHAADNIIDIVNLEGLESAAYLNEYITLNLIKDYIINENIHN